MSEVPEKDDPIEVYIEFVNQYIDLMAQYTDPLSDTNDIDVHKIKNILGNRLSISNTMVIEQQRYKRILKALKRDYKVWYSEKYTTTRRELNPRELAAAKWLGKSDIEAEIVTKFTEIYKDWQVKIDDATDRLELFRRLIDSWNSLQFDMTNLTKIVEMELSMTHGIRQTKIRDR